ncbi:hypothetical protein [Streptomyces buecherae]|uniref:hypothetical protein n=1 Tax=Streptomyces buecherae TaxID=2763006 RepID=UPI0037B668EB
MLYVNSLRVPAVADRIRAEFAHVLDTPAGRIGEKIALAETLQAVGRGWYVELTPLLRRRAEDLTGVRSPTRPPPIRPPDRRLLHEPQRAPSALELACVNSRPVFGV